MKLFGTDGIRDHENSEIFSQNSIKKLVCSISSSLKKTHPLKQIVIGHDTRRSSPIIHRRIIKSLRNHSTRIINTKIMSTPGLSYLCKKWKCELGIMITASHNPYYYNGIKFLTSNGTKISTALESKVEKRYITSICRCKNMKTTVASNHNEAKQEYFNKLSSITSRSSGQYIIDCANGVASIYAREYFELSGYNFRAQFANSNNKPNYNCGAEQPGSLQRLMKKNEIGIIYDGDMDRAIFLDENKRLVDGDYTIALFSLYMLNNKIIPKKSVIVLTSMANLGLELFLKRIGLHPVRTDVGDRNVLNTMKKTGSILGGEQSGHIILRRVLPTGCGLATSLYMIKCLGNADLKGVYKLFNKFPQKLVSFRVKEKIPFEDIPRLPQLITKSEKLLHGRGRIVIRYSGTENKCRVMVECDNMRKLNGILSEICSTINRVIGA